MKASELMAILESGGTIRRLPPHWSEDENPEDGHWLYCGFQGTKRPYLWGFGSAVSSTDEHIIGFIMLNPERWEEYKEAK